MADPRTDPSRPPEPGFADSYNGHYGDYRYGDNGFGWYYENGEKVYGPSMDPYYEDGFNFMNWIDRFPRVIGHWIGKGVNSYTESSTEFERDWNSYENQMDRASAAGLNGAELFASGGLNNGSVSTQAFDPLSAVGGYLSNFIDLAEGLADLRAKKIANDSSFIDLKRKQFEDSFFYGDPGESYTEESLDADGNPVVIIGKRGYRPSIPELNYKRLQSGERSDYWSLPEKEYNAKKYRYGIDNFSYADDFDYELARKQWDSYNSEYSAKRNKLSYEWESFLKDDLGIDPRSSPWLTSFFGFLRNQSSNDSAVGRFLYGLLQFLKGNY